MPNLKYEIKSKADLKAIKDTERSVKDLGRETEKTTKKLQEQARATKESDRSLKEAAKSGDNFAKKIGKQVFGSLVSFAVVTKAVQALRTVFSPALKETTDAASDAGEALGRFIAANTDLSGMATAFKSAADGLNAFADANRQVELGLRKTVDLFKDPDVKSFLAGELGTFRAESGAFAAADARALAGFDIQTEAQARAAEAAGAPPTEVAAMRQRRAGERSALLESFNRRDLARAQEAFAEIDPQDVLRGVQDTQRAMLDLDAARRERNAAAVAFANMQRQVSKVGLEKGFAVGPEESEEEFARRRETARQRMEDARRRVAELTGNVERARARGFGLTTFEQMAAFESTLDAQRGQIARDVTGAANARVLSAEQGMQQANIGMQVARFQEDKEMTRRLLQLHGEMMDLIKANIPATGDAVRALQREQDMLKSRMNNRRVE